MSAPQTTAPQFVTKGQGKAIHIAHVYDGGNVATKCDGWGASGVYGSRIRPTTGPATCKSCLKAA